MRATRKLQARAKDGCMRRTKAIWKDLIDYANTDVAAESTAARKLERLILRCAPHLQAEGKSWPTFFSEAHRYAKGKEVAYEEAFRFWSVYYHEELRHLLTWVIKPDKHPELQRAAVRFLQQYTHGTTWEIEENPFANFDESSNDYHPVFYWKSVEYQSIMDPICELIFRQLEAYHEEGLALNEAIPIRICARPACGKFILPEKRGRKRYCSDLCCALVHQHEKSPEEKRDYMWLYRLERYGLPVLRRNLRLPKTQARLAHIEGEWPQLAERARAIRARAAGAK